MSVPRVLACGRDDHNGGARENLVAVSVPATGGNLKLAEQKRPFPHPQNKHVSSEFRAGLDGEL